MARIFIDGFESGDYSLWDYTPSAAACSVVATSAYEGSGVANFSGDFCFFGGEIRKSFTGVAEIYGAFRYYYHAGSGNMIALFGNDMSDCFGVLELSDTMKPRIYSGNKITLLETASASLTPQLGYLIEFYYKPSADVDGRFQVKVGGQTVINYTGATSPFNANVDGFVLNYGGGEHYFDDIVLDSATWVGSSRILAIVPSAAGALTQWTPSAGSNWDCVNEFPFSDADYNGAVAVDLTDLYTCTDISEAVVNIGNIKSVQIQARAKQEGIAAGSHLALGLRTGTTNYFSSDKVLLEDTYTELYNIWELNPNTSLPFTKLEINALEIGVKSRA